MWYQYSMEFDTENNGKVLEEQTDETHEYKAFVDKFKPKKTTDDCYTPDAVYDAVRAWAVQEYGLEGREIVRPFWPGWDYREVDYPKECVVIDNPPFSILSKICRWYDAKGIDYFLFAPGLVLFSIAGGAENYIIADAEIKYKNGAVVRTGFVTNLGDYKIVCAPDLYQDILMKQNGGGVVIPTYTMPEELVTAARLQKSVKYGMSWRAKRADVMFVRTIDAMKAKGKSIYGAGFLTSKKAAAERAAAERAAAERAAVWELSEREREIVKNLGDDA